jgi:hypothetical protein
VVATALCLSTVAAALLPAAPAGAVEESPPGWSWPWVFTSQGGQNTLAPAVATDASGLASLAWASQRYGSVNRSVTLGTTLALSWAGPQGTDTLVRGRPIV